MSEEATSEVQTLRLMGGSFEDDSDDEGNEGACETDPGQAVAYMRAPPSRFVTKGETALTPVVFPEDSDDDEENVSAALFTEASVSR